MISPYAQEKLKRVEALTNAGKSIAQACKETQTGVAAYYGWKKKLKVKAKKRKYTRKSEPFIQTVALEAQRPTTKFFVLVGDPAEVMRALAAL